MDDGSGHCCLKVKMSCLLYHEDSHPICGKKKKQELGRGELTLPILTGGDKQLMTMEPLCIYNRRGWDMVPLVLGFCLPAVKGHFLLRKTLA